MGIAQKIGELFSQQSDQTGTATLDRVETLIAAVNRANDGDYSEEIAVSGDDAVGSLADGLQALVSEVSYTKAQLADKEAQLAALQKSQATIEFNLEGKILDANENFLDAMGYQLDEVKGQHHRIFVDPKYAGSAEYRQFWSELARGEFKEAEFQRFRKDGSTIWIRASYNPVMDSDGKPYRVIKFAADITKEKMESAFHTGQVEAIGKSMAMIEFETDGTIVSANDHFLAAVGYSLDEIQGRHHRMFVDREYAEGNEYRRFWNELGNGEYKSGEFKRINKDGSEVWIQASYNPVLGPDGTPIKIVKFASDITQTKNEAVRVNQLDAIVRQATAMVYADEDCIVRFMNPAALETLRSLEQHLPVRADEIVGQSIDVFHKNPAHQRGILANPSNLPLTTQISVGPETLDLEVKAVYDADNNRLGSMVTWEIVTKKLEMQRTITQIQAMVRQASAMVFADEDYVVRFMNPAALKTLRSLEQHLPIRADEIVGQSIDIFHKNPHHQRGILDDPSNLPLTTQISVGPETLDLEVKAVFDDDNNRLGSMVTWDIVTKKLEMERQIKETAEQERKIAVETQKKVDIILGLVNSVADGHFDLDVPDLGNDAIGQVAAALNKAIASVREALVEVSDVSSTVATASTEMSSAAAEISKGAQQQAARLEETAASLEEITSTVKQNSENAQEARQLANSSRDIATEGGSVVSDAVMAMSEINGASKKIADIITTIDEIAFQTNLLALNAAVEAARAGEQGRGFAVVAAEVRSLAQRSASSAKEIKSLIQDSNRKVENGTELVNKSGATLNEIVESVKRVTDIVAEIAAASQEQLIGIEQVNRAVTQMDHVTQANASQTEELAGTSGSVLSNARRLEERVSAFELGDPSGVNKSTPNQELIPPPPFPMPENTQAAEDFIEF